MPWRLTLLLFTCFGLSGCIDSGVSDSNVEVFQTADEVAVARQTGQVRRWKEAAIAILKTDRPDLTATAGQDSMITIRANELSRNIDLNPVADRLAAEPDRIDLVLRRYLAAPLDNFDQQRLANLPLEQLRSKIRPKLLSANEVEDYNNRLAANSRLLAVPVADTLYWVPAVHWPNSSMATPIGRLPLIAWNITAAALERLALENVTIPSDPFDITTFGQTGQLAQLKPTTDPAIILLPGFLPMVHKDSHMQGDLALLATSPGNIRFLEARRKALLDSLYPQWNRTIQDMRYALAHKPLCITPNGIGLLNYDPPVQIHRLTTLPTTQPKPTTRPKPYIVR